jgi:BirA family biotin operon repressor/biotin-[acetyl-CoA-carboxylase] ligase
VLEPGALGLAVDGEDYVWHSKPDLLDVGLLKANLGLRALRVFRAVGSTNTEMMALSELESADRVLYTSECQVQGKGRRGREWSSPFAKNLAFSYGHRTARTMTGLGGLSLVVGLAMAEGINGLAKEPVQVKWPNDIVVGERKACGILVELSATQDRVEAVIGVGVNVNLDKEDVAEIDRSVVDLRTLGVHQNRTELLIRIVPVLQQFLERFEDQGFGAFIEAFNESHVYHGKTCMIHQGRQIIKGRVEGVGGDGSLLLSTDQGTRSFHGGEVSLRSSELGEPGSG